MKLKVALSIHDEGIWVFNRFNISSLTVAVEPSEPPGEMSTSNFLGEK
jgi:hypothetical protein